MVHVQDTVVSALKLILDPKNYPLSVMCNLGRHRSGRVPRELVRMLSCSSVALTRVAVCLMKEL
jgi:protein tyrosine/serine phosphatase